LNTYEYKKKMFEEVRDIPFEIVFGASIDYQKAIESLKIHKKAGCTSKHLYLGNFYEKLGSKVLYLTYIFYWEDQEFLNRHLKNLSKNLPERYHLALKVDNELIDATFDKFLAPIFPVNEFENCEVSVVYVDKIEHHTVQERIEYVKSKTKNMNELLKFYEELNRYLIKIRNKNKKTYHRKS